MFNKLSDTIKQVGKIMEKELKNDNKKFANIPDVLKTVLRTKAPDELIEKLSKYKNAEELIDFYTPITRYPFYETLKEYQELGVDIHVKDGNYIIFAEDKMSKSDKEDLIEMIMNEEDKKMAKIDEDYIRIIKSNLKDNEIKKLIGLNKEEDK